MLFVDANEKQLWCHNAKPELLKETSDQWPEIGFMLG